MSVHRLNLTTITFHSLNFKDVFFCMFLCECHFYKRIYMSIDKFYFFQCLSSLVFNTQVHAVVPQGNIAFQLKAVASAVM